MSRADLDAVRDLKTEATAERKRGENTRALQRLDEAVALLHELLDDETPGSAAERALHNELADTHGMRGGVLRRMQQPVQALQAYRLGEQEEAQTGRSSTYNLVNVIALTIEVEQAVPTEPTVQGLLAAATAALQRDTQGRRRSDWWAWADLAQVLLLDGQADAARLAQADGQRHAGPSPEEVRVHAEGLARLAQQLEQGAPAVAAAMRASAASLRA